MLILSILRSNSVVKTIFSIERIYKLQRTIKIYFTHWKKLTFIEQAMHVRWLFRTTRISLCRSILAKGSCIDPTKSRFCFAKIRRLHLILFKRGPELPIPVSWKAICNIARIICWATILLKPNFINISRSRRAGIISRSLCYKVAPTKKLILQKFLLLFEGN